ncbi:amidohydrolase [Vibrio sp. HN007]|uniref:amidohydrolase n=1 Tax=Vibrio iocasae TaxID=3098914 RepID=UPI0035D51748
MSNNKTTFDAPGYRKKLHQNPELSCHERETAITIAQQLKMFGLEPVTNISGYGLICTVEGKEPGPTTLLRADFDAIAVQEKAKHAHVSQNDGVMHGCGHDGHTTSLLKVAQSLSQNPPEQGKVVLLFQPAEETGTGANSMLNHPKLNDLKVDNVFAYHNLPGHPLHEIVVKQGTFACASTGVCIELQGKTSHAAYPEKGISPVGEMVEIISFLQQLPEQSEDKSSLVTIVYAKLGEEAYGVSAGSAKIMATLRSESNHAFNSMKQQLTDQLSHMQQHSDLAITHSWHEPFNAAVNSDSHVELLKSQAQKLGLSITELNEPLRWSEDFSEFLLKFDGALFGIGSGQHHPELHNPDYDFPDEILDTACNLFMALIKEIHGLRSS